MNLSLASPVCNLFEELATGTWERIMFSILFSCSQGENTITDLNLLELCRFNAPGIRIYKAIGWRPQQWCKTPGTPTPA